VKKIEDIVQPPLGTEWIGVSYEWRKAVILASWENAINRRRFRQSGRDEAVQTTQSGR